MSDEFFDRYNSLNNSEPKAETEQPKTSENIYSQPTVQPRTSYYSAPKTESYNNTYSNPYAGAYSRPVQQTQPTASTSGSGTYVDSDGYYHRSFTEHRSATPTGPQTPPTYQPKRKKEKGSLSKGAVATLLIVCIIISGFAGFGGSLIASQINNSATTADDSESAYDTVNDSLVIHKVSVKDVQSDGTELTDKSTDEITKAVADSVVEITTETVQTSNFYGQYVSQGAGSGVIISDDGYIITNNHVIEDASTITVALRNGNSYDATLVGRDPEADVALIKINETGLTTAVFGDSSTIEVGDKSVIIGNPLGTLGGSVTEGIVSALDRSIVIDGTTMHLMQTDAAINPGNSGGGMFNGQGELVGIVVAKSGASEIDNIGFVIPINDVLEILGDLKQYGYVRGKADTGMSFIDISNSMYAWYYFNASDAGVFVSSVESGSAAESAGFRQGDRIISVDGKTISESSDITEIISGKSAGDTITFEIERSGRTGSIELTLQEYVPSSSDSKDKNTDTDRDRDSMLPY